MTFLSRIRSAWRYTKLLPWTETPAWEAADAAELAAFLNTPTGSRLKASMVNLVLRQQERALSDPRHLEYEAGFVSGQKAMLTHLLETWPNAFTEQTEVDAAPATNPEHPNTAWETVTIP